MISARPSCCGSVPGEALGELAVWVGKGAQWLLRWQNRYYLQPLNDLMAWARTCGDWRRLRCTGNVLPGNLHGEISDVCNFILETRLPCFWNSVSSPPPAQDFNRACRAIPFGV